MSVTLEDPGTAIGLGLGLLGIALTVFLYFRAKERPRPVFATLSHSLLHGDAPGLPRSVEILYGGRPVPALVKAYVAIWNDGRRTLDGADIASADPLRIDFEDETEVLRVRLVQRTREVNCVTCEPKDSTLYLAFDFLDPGDGALIEILHTSARATPKVMGTIKGVPDGFTRRGRIPPPETAFRDVKNDRRFMGAHVSPHSPKLWTLIGMPVIGIGLLVSVTAFLIPEDVWVRAFSRPVFLTISALYIAFGGFLLWYGRSRIPGKVVPGDGELFGGEDTGLGSVDSK